MSIRDWRRILDNHQECDDLLLSCLWYAELGTNAMAEERNLKAEKCLL